jgi:aquaporin Z
MRASTSSRPAEITIFPGQGIGHVIQQHWPEYLMEGAELAAFMISACVFTVTLFHPQSPAVHALPSVFFRRALIGLAMGITAVGIVYSPWGQRSGAHFNPAFTLTFWRLKKIDTVDAIFYIAAQFVGGALGVWISKLIVGNKIADSAVNYAVTVPGPHGVRTAFVAELLISLLLFSVVLLVSNQKSLTHYTPLFVGTLVALYITFEAPLSGMSMNPARTLGSAVISNVGTALWIYFTAPPLGMLLAAEVFVRLHGQALCAKLHHSNSKRCIFRCAFDQIK